MADLEQSSQTDADARKLADAIEEYKRQMAVLKSAAESFGKTFTESISASIIEGKRFEQVLKNIALQMSQLALNAAMGSLQPGVSSFAEKFLVELLSVKDPEAQPGLVKAARGGVVTAPTFFNAGGNLGVMGEAGPEAILPLRRGSDGRLGVQATNPAAASSPPLMSPPSPSSSPPPSLNVTFNISTPDVEGFRKSEAQIASMLTRTVNRGRRNL